MFAKRVREHFALDSTGTGYLEHAMEQLNFSARAHDHIQSQHVLEAIQYRSLDRLLSGKLRVEKPCAHGNEYLRRRRSRELFPIPRNGTDGSAFDEF